MRIASWNVNSIKTRLHHVLEWLESTGTDTLLLQELKGTEFPYDAFKDAGYYTAAVTEKSYNGTAIISKQNTKVIQQQIETNNETPQARYLEADINGHRIICIYAPNGNPCPGEKYDYKLTWYKDLIERIKILRESRTPFLIGGDFNIIPEDKDCYDPEIWEEDALFKPEIREIYRTLVNMGMSDAFRLFNNNEKQYTFWDYQAGAWPKNNGLRIDHFLCSPQITDKLKSCTIDKSPRSKERPSDHTPIIVELET